MCSQIANMHSANSGDTNAYSQQHNLCLSKPQRQSSSSFLALCSCDWYTLSPCWNTTQKNRRPETAEHAQINDIVQGTFALPCPKICHLQGRQYSTGRSQSSSGALNGTSRVNIGSSPLSVINLCWHIVREGRRGTNRKAGGRPHLSCYNCKAY